LRPRGGDAGEEIRPVLRRQGGRHPDRDPGALASGEADAGFLTTITLLPSADTAPPPVRPLLTFGAQRNPKLPAVPTFKERAGDPKGSITSAISVFAPRTLRKDVATTIEAVMAEIAA